MFAIVLSLLPCVCWWLTMANDPLLPMVPSLPSRHPDDLILAPAIHRHKSAMASDGFLVGGFNLHERCRWYSKSTKHIQTSQILEKKMFKTDQSASTLKSSLQNEDTRVYHVLVNFWKCANILTCEAEHTTWSQLICQSECFQLAVLPYAWILSNLTPANISAITWYRVGFFSFWSTPWRRMAGEESGSQSSSPFLEESMMRISTSSTNLRASQRSASQRSGRDQNAASKSMVR